MADDTQAETEDTTAPKRRRGAVKPTRERTEGSTVRLPERNWVDGGLHIATRELR